LGHFDLKKVALIFYSYDINDSLLNYDQRFIDLTIYVILPLSHLKQNLSNAAASCAAVLLVASFMLNVAASCAAVLLAASLMLNVVSCILCNCHELVKIVAIILTRRTIIFKSHTTSASRRQRHN
jgi:hypothetical protein